MCVHVFGGAILSERRKAKQIRENEERYGPRERERKLNKETGRKKPKTKRILSPKSRSAIHNIVQDAGGFGPIRTWRAVYCCCIIIIVSCVRLLQMSAGREEDELTAGEAR